MLQVIGRCSLCFCVTPLPPHLIASSDILPFRLSLSSFLKRSKPFVVADCGRAGSGRCGTCACCRYAGFFAVLAIPVLDFARSFSICCLIVAKVCVKSAFDCPWCAPRFVLPVLRRALVALVPLFRTIRPGMCTFAWRLLDDALVPVRYDVFWFCRIHCFKFHIWPEDTFRVIPAVCGR